MVLGPGARAGLGRMFSGVTSSEVELHYTKWLTRVLPYCFKALELDFVEFLGKKLSIKHIEHGLCEYENYFRLGGGDLCLGPLLFLCKDERLRSLCLMSLNVLYSLAPLSSIDCAHCISDSVREPSGDPKLP